MDYSDSDSDYSDAGCCESLCADAGVQLYRTDNGFEASLPDDKKATPHSVTTRPGHTPTLVVAQGHPVFAASTDTTNIAVLVDGAATVGPASKIATSALAVGAHAVTFVVDGVQSANGAVLEVVAPVAAAAGGASVWKLPPPVSPDDDLDLGGGDEDADVPVPPELAEPDDDDEPADRLAEPTAMNILTVPKILAPSLDTHARHRENFQFWDDNDWPAHGDILIAMQGLMDFVSPHMPMVPNPRGVHVRVGGNIPRDGDFRVSRQEIEAAVPRLEGKALIMMFVRKEAFVMRTDRSGDPIAGLLQLAAPDLDGMGCLSRMLPLETADSGKPGAEVEVGTIPPGSRTVRRVLLYVPPAYGFCMQYNSKEGAHMRITTVEPAP